MSLRTLNSSHGFDRTRLKWVLEAIESGRRETDYDGDNLEGILSIGGEHVGWHGEWLLENPRYISREFFDTMSTGIVKTNDILLVKDGATIGKAAIVEELPSDLLAVNEHIFLLRVSKLDSAKFYFYVIQSSHVQEQIWLEVRGSAQPGLSSEFRNNTLVPRPSLDTQRSIAKYLNQEIGRLDALITAKERLLELLAEKRRAFIIQAVTRGLNSNVALRHSKITWLDKIPSHWRVERSRWLFRERDERSQMGEEELLTVSHLTGVTPRHQKDVYMFEADTKEGYKVCRRGDLVINTLWAWMGAMGISPIDGIVSPAYNVYEPLGQLEPGYIDALVRTPVFAQEVIRYSKGVWSSRLRLYPDGFFEIWLPIPPIHEQRQIVSFISEEIQRLDMLGAATERTIELLKERRAALITAAVTGQIDVEEMVA